MTKWKLHTTLEDDAESLARGISRGDRKFAWLHVFSDGEKREREKTFREFGCEVLTCVPIWFVLACDPDAPEEDKLRMCRTINEGAQAEEALWRGNMFGYGAEEIAWYVDEVDDAWARYWCRVGDEREPA
jgi:hypothetical protein